MDKITAKVKEIEEAIARCRITYVLKGKEAMVTSKKGGEIRIKRGQYRQSLWIEVESSRQQRLVFIPSGPNARYFRSLAAFLDNPKKCPNAKYVLDSNIGSGEGRRI